jgi:hypothetical protein
MVDKTAEEDESGDEVKLTVIEPAPKPTPVGVGASDGGEEPAEQPPETDAPAEDE